MDATYHVANALSIALFLSYGLLVLFADGMANEFRRFGLSRFRRLTGLLEVLGALGLAAGYAFPPLTVPSAAGLALLMILGVGVRVHVRDSLVEMLPALFLLLVNGFILVRATGA